VGPAAGDSAEFKIGPRGCLEESKPDFVVRVGIALSIVLVELARQPDAVPSAPGIRRLIGRIGVK
jgi:hypothetical protein